MFSILGILLHFPKNLFNPKCYFDILLISMRWSFLNPKMVPNMSSKMEKFKKCEYFESRS